VIESPDAMLSELEMTDEAERKLILEGFNDTYADYPRDMTVHQMFEKNVDLHPNDTAVIFRDKKLSYGELNEQSKKIAAALRAENIGPNDIVGIMAERSLAMVIGIMGILKAGGAYLPIDPAYPEDRIRYILADSKAKALITREKLKNRSSELYQGIILAIDKIISSTEKNQIKNTNRTDDLCYVIYTSGTTGRPKGVLVEHRNVVAYIHAFYRKTGLNKADVLVEQHAFTFDAFAEGLFGSLLSGAALVIPDDKEAQDLRGFVELVEKNKGTMVMVSPLFLSEMNRLPRISSVHSFVCGGDVLKWEYISRLMSGSVIYNNYGPTEATISATIFKCEKILKGVVPIGRPINNYKIIILDPWDMLNPVGVPGELCISGEGLARGYLGRPELTEKKFVENPYWSGYKMYRTGDLARWRADGNIEFMGRIDQQVKVRGYRIELGEIEAQLQTHPDLKSAAVLVLDDNAGEKFLCAYFCADHEMTVKQLRKHLSMMLPEYMIPQMYVQLERLPLTSHGKLDREALSRIKGRIGSGTEYQAPSNKTEIEIAETWKKLLSLEKVGVNDDFFLLGGDSIKAVRMVSLLSDRYKINLTDIFENRTVSKLACLVSFRSNDVKQAFERVRKGILEEDQEKGRRISRELDRQAKEYEKKMLRDKKIDLDKRVGYNEILLTGATGYLGIYLLRELLTKQKGRVTVLVRAANDLEATRRLEQKWAYYFGTDLLRRKEKNVHVLCGDIIKDRLGLNLASYNALTGSTNCIIHSAADTRHFGNYEDFHRANVKGTENLLEFAGSGKNVVFNHVSTISVGSGDVEGKEAVLFTEYHGDIGQRPESYYTMTKLEAEKLVASASMEKNIFRAGNLTFDSTNGRFQENMGENAFYIMLRSFITLGIMPDLDIRNVDLTFVDQAAAAIVKIFDRLSLAGGNHHILNGNYVSVRDIATMFIRNGLPIKILEIPEFLEKLERLSDDEKHSEAAANILIHSHLLEEMPSTYFDVTGIRTRAVLERLDFRWKKPGKVHFEKMLRHCREKGFIP
jgi:amino acid adenylation domain-containing protein/thioester reductase-like protein